MAKIILKVASGTDTTTTTKLQFKIESTLTNASLKKLKQIPQQHTITITTTTTTTAAWKSSSKGFCVSNDLY
jgi:hypothetical protein